jgi:putative tryptophan/tyrosine transport system substrate-binding protein
VRRRDLIALVVGAAALRRVARPLAASAQLPTIGVLGASTPTGWSAYIAAFVQRLHELGWVEGRNIAIEYRWAEGHTDRFAEIAAELVRLKVSMIVTVGSAAVAAKGATSTIPIVFALDKDPVASGLVASLPRPGGNVTGLSLQSTDLVGKRLGLLREVVPGVRRLAVLANVGYPGNVLELADVRATAVALGMAVETMEIRRAEDIAPAFAALNIEAQALYLCSDAFITANLPRILALSKRLPSMHMQRDYVEAGGLISYGPSNTDLFRRAGDFADKILRGAKPADIPVEQPTKFELVVNLKTAKALGLDIPSNLLAVADEVIE